ncbi:MAG: TIGR04283 family arsenosugar biosynthesis glycosyltransferase [Pseudomonadota bacterium]
MITEPLTVAVIVPVYNEAAIAQAVADSLRSLMQSADIDVIVVDGTSSDGTADTFRAAGLPVLDSRRGRAVQMNAGAKQTDASVLVFLHADTRLPDDAIALVREAVTAGAVWGRFDIRIDGKSVWFPLIAAMINWRSRRGGHATGDQAIFVRRDAFESVGCFPDQPLMEDVEISRRLRKIRWPVCIAQPAITSGRRWDTNGVWRTVFLMWRLRFAYWRGVPAEKLAALYA